MSGHKPNVLLLLSLDGIMAFFLAERKLCNLHRKSARNSAWNIILISNNIPPYFIGRCCFALFGISRSGCTQWCKFMSKNLKFLIESRADGEGILALQRNIKSASFHARSDSEIYTTEYFPLRGCVIPAWGCPQPPVRVLGILLETNFLC